MNEPYKRAKNLFLTVCDLDPADRGLALDRECAADDGLRKEVESLLEHYDEPTRATRPSGPVIGAERAPTREPRRIGAYRIIRELGRGGMGVVYLAVRNDDRFTRHVALKVLKRGTDTEDILRRFDQERQVLAALNHPGIARLYDAGETEDGLPYFAMEYVEGQRIDEYCDTHRLRIGERLELFRQLCTTVHYVHKNLMVHRDLKPSNILVTGDGVPKLLDFGIAKLINPGMALFVGDPTATEQRIMTPEYASPEQVRGDPISVASDIYSLGVILYELLTGHRPYRIQSRVDAEIKRVICEVDPERPSTVVTRVEVIEPGDRPSGASTTITPVAVAKVREGQPARLRRRLAGDIDNIVLKTLRKEPQRRYESADQIANDIGRHLDGLPVIARPDTPGYRFSKFVYRNRRSVVAAAVFVVALIGWGVTATYGLIGEIRHREAVQAERDRTWAERDRTRRMLDEVLELANVFIGDFNNQLKSLDGSLPLRTLLAETAQECLEDLKPDVGNDPKLLRTLANAYDRVGVIWGGHRGESLGKTAIALENHETALAMRQELLARDPDDSDLRYELALSYRRIGDVLRFTGDVNGAVEHYLKYLEIAEGLAQENPRYRRGLAIALGTVGSAHKRRGDLEEAQHYYQRSLNVRLGLLAERPDDPQVIKDIGVGYLHLGEPLAVLGDPEGALTMYLKSLEHRERLVRDYPKNSTNRRYLALSHYFAAGALIQLDRPDDAAAHVKQALRVFEQRAKDNPSSARAQQDLALGREIQGRLQLSLGDHLAALESFRLYQTLATALTELNPDQILHVQMLADSHAFIGDVHREMGDLPAAVRPYRQAYEVIRPVAEADPSDIDLRIQLGRILSGLGGLPIEAGDLPDEARKRLADARSIQESVLHKAPEHARAREGLVLTLRRLSCWAAERGYAEQALRHAQEALEVAGERDAAVLGDLAAMFAASGDLEQARALAQEALDSLAGARGPKGRALRESLQQDLASYHNSSGP